MEDIEAADYFGGGVPHKSFTLPEDEKSTDWGEEEEFVLADSVATA